MDRVSNKPESDAEPYSEESFQPEESTTPLQGKLFLLVMLGLTLLGFLALLFLTSTLTGEKVFNAMFPNSERTVRIIQQLAATPTAFTYTIETEDSRFVGGTYFTQSLSVGEFTFDIKASVPSSTLPAAVVDRQYALVDGEVFVSDVYGDTFIDTKDAYISSDVLATLQTLQSLLTVDFKRLVSEINVQSFAIESDTDTFLIKSNHQPPTWLVFDTKTYALDHVRVSRKDLQITLTPVYEETRPAEIQYSRFGDVLARESVAIRTEFNGRFDYLWHQWEDEYFECYRCVYRLGDEDGDGIDNEAEFVLGTNPLIKTNIENSALPERFVNIFSSGDYHDSQYGGRSGIATFNADIPTDAKALTFEYSLPLKESDKNYFGVYLNGSMQAILDLTEAGATTSAAIPLPPGVAGTSTELAFIFNSYGPKGSNIQLRNISYLVYSESRSVPQRLRDTEYEVFIDRRQIVKTTDIELGEGWTQGQFSDLKTVPAVEASATLEDQVIPGITLAAQNEDEVGMITYRIDEPNMMLPSMCVHVAAGKQNGHIEFQFLPDEASEHELLGVYDLDTLFQAISSSDQNSFVEVNIIADELGQGQLVIGVFSNGEGDAAATFANFEYYTPKLWATAQEIYGSADSVCHKLQLK